MIFALALTVIGGIALIALTGGRRSVDQVHAIGVLANGPVVELPPGQEVCQGPITAAEPLEVMSIVASTPGKGPELMLRARSGFGGRTMSSSLLDGDYGGPAVQIGGPMDPPVPADTPFAACVENVGRRSLTLLGDTTRLGYAVNTTSEARLEGEVLPGDLGVYFPAQPASSLLETIPNMVQRAAVFRPNWIGPWTFWLMLPILAVGLPALLGWAALRTVDEDEAEPQAPVGSNAAAGESPNGPSLRSRRFGTRRRASRST